MQTKTRVPALGADGWFTEEGETPALLGNRCKSCGTVFFPKASLYCRNPRCEGTEFEETRLSNTGKVWSATNAEYQPPPPFVATTDPFEPFALAAVELEREGMIVLGQVVAGVGVEELSAGTEVELVIDTLFEDDEHEYTIWKWRPVE